MAQAPPHYAFDATPLSAFSLVGRLDLLRRRYAGRAHWAVEVYDEIARGIAETPSLAAVLTADWLGEPISCLAVDDIQTVRLRLGGKSRDKRHLGEAATIVLAARNGWVAATDDRDATRLAKAEGVPTIGTIPILQATVRDSLITASEAKAILDELIDVHGRRLPPLGLDAFDLADTECR